MEDEIRLTKVGFLRPTSRRVNLRVKVLEVGEEKNVVSRKDGREHRVADALVGDDTGVIYMTLWDTNIDKVKAGETILVKNGYITTFRNEMRLTVGRYGSLEESDEEVVNVNSENNMSRKFTMRRPPRRRF